jgi:ribosomal protein S18 acetylase RimI-like enzyme
MEPNDKKLVKTVARVMSESFLEDPMNRAQLKGMNNPDALLEKHSMMHSLHAMKNKSLSTLNGDGRAFMIGFDSTQNSKFREVLFMIRMFLKTFFLVSWKDFDQLRKNMKQHGKVLSFDWHKKFISGRHYRIKIIAIDQELRGTGAFRKLITPAIEFADRESIPMVLETHNPSNVGLYEHFGFKLVKTISSPKTPIQQYCMIRKPIQVSIPTQAPKPKAKQEKKLELWPRLEMMI